MQYMMLPLDQHFDRGFGAVADAFTDSADSLSDRPVPSMNAHLPVSFLYRHAIELYFKSAILIFHRKFQLPFGETPHDGEPQVPVQGKWKPMYNVHQLKPLYDYFCTLFADQSAYLAKNTNTDWSFPEQFGRWIEAIEATDSSSTFFRYPITKHAAKDKEKSVFREVEYEQMINAIGERKKPLKAFVIVDQNDEVVQSFSRDDGFAEEALTALRGVAKILHDYHAALVGELTGGW